jgi:hypothetical protein
MDVSNIKERAVDISHCLWFLSEAASFVKVDTYSKIYSLDDRHVEALLLSQLFDRLKIDWP